MRHIRTENSLPSDAEEPICFWQAHSPQHCGGIVIAELSAPEIFLAGGSIDPFCRPAKRGAKGAGKTLVTDYCFVGPGYATHKIVGWGRPQTPPAPAGATA